MVKWDVYSNPDELEELYTRTTFNYKNDVKNISKEQLDKISEEIGNQLHSGLSGGSSYLYFGKDRKASYAKIRVVDIRTDNGKSKGFRCIVLVDFVHHAAFILHLCKHGNNRDEITKADKKKLRALVDEYIDSMQM